MGEPDIGGHAQFHRFQPFPDLVVQGEDGVGPVFSHPLLKRFDRFPTIVLRVSLLPFAERSRE